MDMMDDGERNERNERVVQSFVRGGWRSSSRQRPMGVRTYHFCDANATRRKAIGPRLIGPYGSLHLAEEHRPVVYLGSHPT